MALRTVLLGWGGDCLEFGSALDADATVSAGIVRVSLVQWGGPLADATVLVFDEKYLDVLGGHESEHASREAMRRVLELPMVKPRRFDVETPIPIGAAT